MNKMKKNRYDRSIPVIIKQILNKKIDTFYHVLYHNHDNQRQRKSSTEKLSSAVYIMLLLQKDQTSNQFIFQMAIKHSKKKKQWKR